MAAWQQGQFLLQQFFARADMRFNTIEVIVTAAIATDRSGNKRELNVCKRSNLIQRGLQHSQKTASLADAWLAWSFQANFMFDYVF